MKKGFFSFALFLPYFAQAAGVEPLAEDTVFRFGDKRIQVVESAERLKVKVFEVTESQDTLYSEKVFEGVYRNGTSQERRYRNSLTIPLPGWTKRVSDPHWAGFGVGFASLTDGSLRINSAPGLDLRSGKSFQFSLNLFDYALPVSRRGWALVSGLGFRWDVYRFDGNVSLQEIEGITIPVAAPPGYYWSTSRLKMTRITVPLLLEWQKDARDDSFFISAGVIAGAKIYSNSVVKYRDRNDRKRKRVLGKDLNLRPVTLDILAQIGWHSFGIYAMYSPFSLFEKDKGPEAMPMAIGAMLYF